jgi:hypothetical protein
MTFVVVVLVLVLALASAAGNAIIDNTGWI